MWGKKRQQIECLKGRIQQLEDLICPNRQHEWICIGRDHEAFGSSVETVYQYLCKRCKKIKWDFEEPWVRKKMDGGEDDAR